MKLKQVVWFAVAGVGVAALGGMAIRVLQTYEFRNNQPGLVSQQPPDSITDGRTGYAPVDLEQVPEASRRPGADPKAIAMTAFGFPENEPVEGNFQQTVTVDESILSQQVVTVTQTNLPDDSVRSVRYRVEFTPAGTEGNQDLWQMSWVGRQFICQSGRGAQEWSSALCN